MTQEEMQELLNSLENLDLVITDTLHHPEYIKGLFEIAFHSNHPKSWRAAWIADKVNEKQPELVGPYINQVILRLHAETDGSKKRHFLKLIGMHPIPDEQCSYLFDYCMTCFTSAREPIAVRVFALQILYNISQKVAELKPELLSIIQHEIELHSSAGIKSRGMKLARLLQSEIRRSGIAFI